jgi:DNA polymerase elongation subunit (family B)
MYNNIDLTNVLVLDIETVSGHRSFEEMSPEMQGLWKIKSEALQRRVTEEDRISETESYKDMSAIYSEFGKIVCISVGVFRRDKESGRLNFHVKSYYGHDEEILLSEFTTLLNKHYNDPKKHFICGHNIKEFDIPYMCRRMLVHSIALPNLFDVYGKKPWDLEYFIDTLNLWRFGDYKAFTSLKLLCGLFGIPTPKDDIDGSEVGKTYWEQDDLQRIEIYCKKDVVATARVFLRMLLMDPMDFEVHES